MQILNNDAAAIGIFLLTTNTGFYCVTAFYAVLIIAVIFMCVCAIWKTEKRQKALESDPEYQEYMRLKKKFPGI